MADGPGIYDAEATVVRHSTNGKIVIVAVVDGNRGSGFSVQYQGEQNPLLVARLLDFMALGIRKEVLDGSERDNLNGVGNSGESGEVAK